MAKPIGKLVDERAVRVIKALEGIAPLVDGITAVLLRNAVDELEELRAVVQPPAPAAKPRPARSAKVAPSTRATGGERISARADVRKRQAEARKAGQA